MDLVNLVKVICWMTWMVQIASKPHTSTEWVLEEENLPIKDHSFQMKYGKMVREKNVQSNLLGYVPDSNSAVSWAGTGPGWMSTLEHQSKKILVPVVIDVKYVQPIYLLLCTAVSSNI